jgi:hypothetical protein
VKDGPEDYFQRPYGEKGEVPDWWFRAKYFKEKGYIPAKKVIRDDEGEEGNSTSSESPLS